MYRVISVFAFSILLISLVPETHATTCSTGSVTASYDNDTMTLVVTATSSRSDTGCQAPGVTVTVEGYNFSRGNGCPTTDPCTLTFQYGPNELACLAPGPHTVTANYFCQFKPAGGFCSSGTPTSSTTSFNVPANQPVISASVEELSPTAINVVMPYSFPGTASYDQRGLKLEHFLPDGTPDTLYWTERADSQSGTFIKQFDPTCWASGDHRFVFTATTCPAKNPRSVVVEATYTIVRKPTVKLSIQKINGVQKAVIHYDFPDTSPSGRSLTLKFLPKFPSTTPTTVPNVPPVSDQTGTVTVDVPAFGTSGILRAVASNYCGEWALDDAAYDCSCNSDEGSKSVGGPVRLWDGSMTYSERDPIPSGGLPLFTRNYDTLITGDGVFGTGWKSVFNSGLTRFTSDSIDTVTIETEGERPAAFVKGHGQWTQSWPIGIRSAATLTQQPDGSWLYREGGSSLIRMFRSDGRFIGFDDRSSTRKVLIDYTTSGMPQRVYATDGTWSCTVTTSANHVTAISVDGRPDLTWQYIYSGSLLQSVALAGSPSAWRTYDYAAGRLSAVHDESGNLIESHVYDAQGRATTSAGGSTTDITNIEYDLPGSLPDSTVTRVTYATGEQTTFDQRFIEGRQRTISTVGGCGSCGSRNATYAFDEDTGRIMRSQDARGYIASFSYDSSGKLVQERRNDRPSTCDPEQDAAHCRMTPAALLAVTLQSTSALKSVSYAYGDPQWPDMPTMITGPSVAKPGDVRVDTVTYDAVTRQPLTSTSSGWINSTTQISTTTTTALYDGVATAAFDPGRSFSSSWLTLPQPAGKRKSVDGPRTDVVDVTTLVYYPIDSSVPSTYRGRLAATENAAGHLTTFENYDVFGNAGRIVDPNGVATETTFDALGRPLITTLKGVSGCDTAADPLCATDLVTSRTYSQITGPLTSQLDANGNVVTYEYDTRGRLTAIARGASTSALKERMELSYDPATSKKSVERYLAMENGSWIEKRRESFAYDALGQLMTLTHPDANSIGYAYDDSGSLASIRDENHTAPNTRYIYDPGRRLSSVHQTLGTEEVVTSYAYDVAGNLTGVTDPNGNATSYTYDDFHRMVSQSSPVTGVTTYAYDAAGNLTSSTDANGSVTARSYDVLGRMVTSVATSDLSSETTSWSYDGTSPFTVGRLATMTDPAGTAAYRYERRGLLLSDSRTTGTILLATSFQYDAAGNRTVIVYPSGIPMNYTYDYAGRPLSLSVWGNTYMSGATYLPFGPETSLTFLNGTTQTRTYDSRYRIQRNTLTSTAGTIADYSYTEDPAGNISTIHDMIDPSYDRDFSYDDLHRLAFANSGTSLWGNGAYTYDRMGNILSRDLGGMVEVDPDEPLSRTGRFSAAANSLPAPGSVHETYAYTGATSKMATITAGGIDHPLAYDAAGNETQYFDLRTYSPRNLMSSITEPSEDGHSHTIRYTYDGRDVRLIRSEGTAGYPAPFANRYFVYGPELQLLSVSVDDNPNVWGKTARSNYTPGMKHEIAWFNGRPVGQLIDGGTIRYTFTDHLGTPILQTDSSATVVWRAEYEPYGDLFTLRVGASAAEQPLRFPGQEYEGRWEGVEERYNIFRWYRGGWGRYTQADPIGLPGGLNQFAYAYASPVTVADNLGLYGVDKSRVREVPLANIRAQCPGLGSACTTGFFTELKCECDCKGGLLSTELIIHGTLHYYPGNPKALGGSHPFDTSVVDAQTSIRHEWEWHLSLGIHSVDALIRQFESKSFSSQEDCERTCKDYGVAVNEKFMSVVRTTQELERRKQDPRNAF